MKILIDTSLPDLFLSVIKDDKTLTYIHKKDLVKKANELPEDFSQLLQQASVKATDIKEVFVTIGPGAFMGVRTALVFAKTFCLMTKAKLYVASSFTLVSKNKDGEYFIDAKGGKFYKAKITNSNIEFALENEGEVSKIDYDQIIEKPNEYLTHFKKAKNILDLEPIYLKDPRIGGE